MKKQTLWKRIFGQKSNKKVKAQQAFQEQFDTKLRFRELEPRVVLDATVDYNAGTGTLSITYTSAGDVTLGRDAGGKLEVTGTNLTFTANAANDFVGKLSSIGTVNVTDNTAGASEFILYGGIGGTGTNALTGQVSLDMRFNNVDTVSVQDGANFFVSDFTYTSNGADTDDNTINFDGEVSIQTSLTFNANGSKSVSVTDTANGAVTTEGLNIQKSGAATGNLSLDLTQGTNEVIQMYASGEEVEIALVDASGNLSLGDINASELSLTTTGLIFGDASSEINVSGTAKLTAASIDLDDSTVGHDFNKLTLNATGTASIVETDGFDFDGSSIIGGALTVDTGGAIGQIGGSELRANSTAEFKVGDASAITLNEMVNRFEGTVSVTGQTDRAGAVTFYDSNGGFQFGKVLATMLDVTTTGSISQTSDGIDVSDNAVFTTMGANAITLNSTNNAFGANVSATGNGGPAATVTIVDSDGTLTLDDVQAASLSATAINGGIAQTTTGVKVTGTSSFTVQDGENVLLTGATANNAFGDAISISGASAAAGTVIVFQTVGDIKLGAVDVTTLTIALDAGMISQSNDGVHVSGSAQFVVGDNKDILLNSSSNNVFGGALTLGSGVGTAVNAAVNNSGTDLLLDSVELSGNLTIVTNGGITQTNVSVSDYVKVGGTSKFSAGMDADVLLGDNTKNEFGTVHASTLFGELGTVSLYDNDGDITLGLIEATDLNVTAAERILQTSDELHVLGTSTLVVGDGKDVLLNTSLDNDFGTVTVTGATSAAGAVFLRDSFYAFGTSGIVLGDINANTLDVYSEENISFAAGALVKAAASATFLQESDPTFGISFGNIETMVLTATASGFINQQAMTSIDATTSVTFNQTSLGGTGITIGDITTDVLTVDAVSDISFSSGVTAKATTSAAFTQTGSPSVGISLGNVETDVLTATADGFINQQTGTSIDATTSVTFEQIEFGGTGIVVGDITTDVLTVDAARNISFAMGVTAKATTSAAFTQDGPSVSGISLGNVETDVLTATADSFINQQAMTSIDATTSVTFNQIDSSGSGITIGDISTDVFEATAASKIDYQSGTLLDATTSATLDQTTGIGSGIVVGNITTDVLTVEAVKDISFATGVTAKATTSAAFTQDGIPDYGISLGNVETDILTATADGFINQQTGTSIDATTSVTFKQIDSGGTGVVVGNITTDVLTVDAVRNISFAMGVTAKATTSAAFTQTGSSSYGISLGNVETDVLTATADGFINQQAMTSIDGTTSVTFNQINSFGSGITVGDITTDVLTVDARRDISFAMGAKVNATTSAAFIQGPVPFYGISLGDIETDVLTATSAGFISQQAGTSINATTSVTFNQTGSGGDGITIGDITTDVLDVTAFNKISFVDGVTAKATTSASFTQKNGAFTDGITLGNVETLDLSVTAGSFVVQEDMTKLDVDGTTTISVGDGKDVTLFNTGNDFTGAVSVSSAGTPATVKIMNDNALLLGNIEATTLQLYANNGDITQVMGTALVIEGTTLAKATDGFDVKLDQAGNDFKDAVSVLGFSMPNDVILVDANDLIIGDIDSKTLTATAGKSITQAMGTSIKADTSVSLDAGTTITTGDITTPMLDLTAGDKISQDDGTSLIVSGMTTVEVPMGVDVDLSEMTNEFGSISVNAVLMDYAGTVTIYDSTGDLVLKDIWADVLIVTVENGGISQMAGTAIYATTSVDLEVSGAMVLGDMTVPMLDLTAGGAISQAPGTSLIVSGMTTIEVGTGENVDLSEAGNDFGSIGVTGIGATTAGDVTIVDADGGIVLKDIIAANLMVTVNDTMDVVSVTQMGGTAVIVSGMTSIANTTGGAVTLSNTGNLFSQIGVTSIDGMTRGAVTFYDGDGGLQLKDIIAGDLSILAEDTSDVVEITQVAMATIDATGIASIFNTTGGTIDLSNAGNDFNQIAASTVDGGTRGDVTIRDDEGGIILEDIAAGNLDVTVNDKMAVVDVTQSLLTLLNVTSMTTVTNNTGGDILLGNDNLLNQFGAITNDGGVRGDVVVNDVDGGIELKDIVAANLTVTVDDSDDEAVDITQAMSAKIDVTVMSLFYNYSSNSVDMVGGNVILSNEGNEFFQIGVIAEDPVTKYRGDVTIRDDDGGIELKNIVAANLAVTVNDMADVVEVTQFGVDTINSTLMTTVTNTTGGLVDLSNEDNEFYEIGVISEDVDAPLRGNVLVTDKDAVILKDFIAATLFITAGGDVTQPVVDICDDVAIDGNTKIIVDDLMHIYLTDEGAIDLRYGRNDIGGAFTVGLDDGMGPELERLTNFHLRNENATPVIFRDDMNMDLTDDDLPEALASSEVDNVTLVFPNVSTDPTMPFVLPEIVISGDLFVEVAGKLTQYTEKSLRVGGDADFLAGQIQFGTEEFQDVIVTGHATFVASSGPIEVGVVSKAIDAIDRGTASDAEVEFGYLTFNAQDAVNGHVTITEDNQMTLVNDTICMVDYINVAQTAVLSTTSEGIETGDGATVEIADLATFDAVTDINLGSSMGSSVDLRILLAKAGGNVSIVEQSDFTDGDADNTALALMDGTKVTGTLAIETGGHLIQVNDIRSDGTGVNVTAGKALFDVDGSILLTKTTIGTLAASAGSSGASALNVTPTSDLAFDSAGVMPISSDSGFTTKATLTTDTIDEFLPDQNTDKFAVAARASGFDDAVGEDYSIVVINEGDLTIDTVSDTLGSVGSVDGLRTFGTEAGDVFLYAKAGGDLNFGKMAPAGTIVGLANSGVITALAADQLTITSGYDLVVTSGADPDMDAAFAAVSKVDAFTDNPASDYEIVDKAPILPSVISPSDQNDGPVYSRVPGNVDTYVLPTQTGKDSVATIVLDKLGIPGEYDFEVTLDFKDTTPLQVEPYADPIAAATAITHDIPWEFATTKASTTVTINAFNSPQINLFEMVVSDSQFNNLNVVVDQFKIFFLTPIDYVPEMTNFVPPTNPYVVPILPPEATPTPYAALTEIADDTRVATQIDGVTVVEVDPNTLMEKENTEVELDDDFMTLDAVKEYIQNGVQFPVGLYKIEILYPGSEEPEVYFYWKQDRLDPFDLFSNNTKSVAPRTAELAAASQATAQLSAEEVWAREYDKWFPTAAELQSTDDLSVPAAEGDSGEMNPSEDDILLERVTTVSLQEIDRMTDRLRAKRSIVRDSLNGAMVGGAALMAAVAAQGRRDDEATNHHPDENGEQPEESLDETSLGRLRRRVRQWL